MRIAATVAWRTKASPMELGAFFAGPAAYEHIEALAFAVVDEAEAILGGVSQPKGDDVHTAVTESAGGKRIYWSTDPDAVAKRLLVKEPQAWPLPAREGNPASVQLIGLVVADHPNSENFQYGLDGFPTTRFFTGAFAAVAARSDATWEVADA